MQLEKEKETREAAERCRLLAQRIAEELAPEAAAVLAADEESGALLEKALRRAGIRTNPWTAAATAQPELLVVEDPGLGRIARSAGRTGPAGVHRCHRPVRMGGKAGRARLLP